MKVNWHFLKKPSVIIGGVILFFILLFLLNKGHGSSSSQQVVNTGPSDAQVASQTQLAMAQLSAGLQGQQAQLQFSAAQDADQTQVALATIAAAVSNNQTAAQQAIAAQTVAAQTHGLDLQYQTALANNAAQIDAMRVQANYGLASAAINANLQAHIMDVQAASFNLGQELAHVNDVRLHGGQRLAVLQNIINTNGAVGSMGGTTVNIANLTAAGQLT